MFVPVLGVKVLISVVMKMTAKLSAKTVTTGAKMTLNIFVIFICLVMLSGNLGNVSLNVSSKTIKGDAAITNRRNQTLIISTTASASNGKKSMRAKAVLIIISPDIFPKLSLPVSEISAKLSNEE